MGCFVVVLFLSSAFFVRGLWVFLGAVLSAPSVPQGCLGGPFGVLLRAARGSQKGPPYRRDWLFLGSLWGPVGCPGGVSRGLFALLLGPFLDELEVGPRG